MLLGYNTNGFAHHDPLDAIRVLAGMGYRSVALTLDHGLLNPYALDYYDQLRNVRDELMGFELRSVVETGARFLLDPYVKHEPTLVSESEERREVRIEFLRRAIDAAAILGSDCVSLWSGVQRDDASDEVVLERLAEGLRILLDYAGERDVVLAFEPEPGMFVDSCSRFARLLQWVEAPQLQMTMDIGHLYCQGELPIADYIARWAPRIANMHIEDMRAGVHEHLMFGEGEMDFPPIIEAIGACGYRGGVHVELSRHSHEAPQAAQRAYEFLSPLTER
jgi:L-ribulose-5-phosphate 3-epimerase